MKAVTREGVRWDHIHYQGPGLYAITQHPDHRKGGSPRIAGGRSCTPPVTWSDATRSTRHVYVANPYDVDNRTIKVPAVRSNYATGLTLHQHRVIVANADSEALDHAEDPEAVLMRSKRRLDKYVQFLMEEREVQGVQKKLARFLEQGNSDHLRSVVNTDTFSPALSRDPVDPRDPPASRRRRRGRPTAPP